MVACSSDDDDNVVNIDPDNGGGEPLATGTTFEVDGISYKVTSDSTSTNITCEVANYSKTISENSKYYTGDIVIPSSIKYDNTH